MNLSKSVKRILSLVLMVLVGGFIAYRITYKPHETIQEMKTDFKGTSVDLLKKVGQHPDSWTNKTVEISGKVTQIDPKSFMIGSQIFCQKNTTIKQFGTLKIGETYQIKGRIIGYDDLLEELKLDQVILL